MTLTGLHLLLTYRCDRECDHCFVWGSPGQRATMTSQAVRLALRQAKELGTVEWVFFEGGEPFLYYPVLLSGVQRAQHMGFRVGIVSNAYWATSLEDALEWLSPFSGWVQELSISGDRYHSGDTPSPSVENACEAARELGIPVGEIAVVPPKDERADPSVGQLPEGPCGVMFRGRAAEKLVTGAPHRSWSEFSECPHEDLREPGRVHLDPLGHVHLCQGISIGNVFQTPLVEICASFDPDGHPIAGPLLEGGPAELTRRHTIEHADAYADACHLCYETRRALRGRFPEALTPDAMYGVPAAS